MKKKTREMIEMPIGGLIPYEKNAKKHDEEQVQEIANSIKRFGFVQPVVIDKDNVVIIGHGRLLGAKEAGLETIPCIRAEDLNKKEIKALRLADNKLNESPWDFGLLNQELVELEDFDMGDFGFEVIDSFSEQGLDSFFEESEPKEKTPRKIQCPHCGEWFEEGK